MQGLFPLGYSRMEDTEETCLFKVAKLGPLLSPDWRKFNNSLTYEWENCHMEISLLKVQRYKEVPLPEGQEDGLRCFHFKSLMPHPLVEPFEI